MNFQQLINHLFECYPYSCGIEGDNFGPQVGDYQKTINKVLISLDITDDVVDEAIEMGADCILSHHPLIYRPLKRICSEGKGRLCYKLIANNICAVSMHTNFDAAPGGVGDRLALILGLENISEFGNDDGTEMLGRIGDISPVSSREFANTVKKNLAANGLRVTFGKDISARVAVLGGSGKSHLEKVALLGADTYVTADCGYHDFQRAKELGITLIDAGHFPTENHAITEFENNLKENFPDIEVVISKHSNIIESI